MLNNTDVAINLELLKRSRFYNIFDPNGPKIFGRNAYRLAYIACAAFVVCTMACGTPGYFFDTDDTFSDVDVLMTVAIHSQVFQILWQGCVLVCHADAVWAIFDVARLDFFKSKGCTMNVSMLRDNRARSIRMTNWYFVLTCPIFVQWMMFPLVKHWFATSENPDRRAENVFNLRFPVDVHTHNANYIVFYAVESTVMVYAMYSSIACDVFTISICQAITFQYEVLSRTFGCVGGREG